MGLSIDGLSSGLDTTALINSLMAVEAIPQSQMKNKAAVQTRISALQGLNTAVADLATKAGKRSDPKAWNCIRPRAVPPKSPNDHVCRRNPVPLISPSPSWPRPRSPCPAMNLSAWPYTTMTVTGRRPGHHGHPAHFIT